MTFRDEVLATLVTRSAIAREVDAEDVAGFEVPRRYLEVRPWGRPGPASMALDCNKRGSLLTGLDGVMSCVEVEVVRILRSRWQAGWVQGFPCGQTTWGTWLWTRTDAPLNVIEINDLVQTARHKGRTFSGHPDVAVTDGHEVAYIECKMKDAIKPSQMDWFGAAFSDGIVRPSQVVVIQGVPVGPG